jgi:hypothetical protein
MAFRYERVRCGKKRCRCMNGGRGHGPYWYEYWRDGPRIAKRYWGRRRPSPRDFADDERRDRRPYDRARMQAAEDRGVLGLGEVFTSAELRRAYKRAAFAAHPDRGGTHDQAVAVNKAYERLRSLLR